jgi:phosphoglycerate dehydrogenase-like enzyme
MVRLDLSRKEDKVMGVKIAVVNSSSFGKFFPEHRKRLSNLGEVSFFNFPSDIKGEELASRLVGFSIIIASVTPYFGKEFFDNKDKTLLIARHGIGYNNIDIKSATEKGVIVTNVPGFVERESVAENAVALLLDVIRNITLSSIRVKEGKWKERSKSIGSEVKNKTVGIIGFGNIGSRVGEILKDGLGAKIIAYDPYLNPDEIQKRGAEPVSLEELLKLSDIISLHAALTPENYHLLSREKFSLMKKGVIIVNVARGELIDTDALIEALKKGIIGAVGLDVIEGEPIDENHPLLKFDNVVITPHISAYTYECLKGMGDKVVSDVEKVLNGIHPANIINPEVLKMR